MKLNLIQKTILFLAVVLIPFFIFLGYTTQRLLENQVINNADEVICGLTISEARDIDNHFKRLEALGENSVIFAKRYLFNNKITEEDLNNFEKKYKFQNGAWRTDPENVKDDPDPSGTFLSNRIKINDEIKREILSAEKYFDFYSDGVLNSVYNMYLISKNRFVMVNKIKWALEVEADHDFDKDIFYYTGTPENNPGKKPVWTPPYHDSIIKRWMTSLICPIYIDGKFRGILGHDVILDDIYKDILNEKYFNSGYGFVYDANKNLVIHPDFLKFFKEKGRMGQELRFTPKLEEGLQHALAMSIDKKDSPSKKVKTYQFTSNGKVYYFHSKKLEFLNWYFGIVIPQEEVLTMLPLFHKKFIEGAVLFGSIIFALITLIVWFYVVMPITHISKGAKVIGTANFDYKIPYHSEDEIGMLAKSINDMAKNLKAITTSKNLLDKEVLERIKTEDELLKFKTSADNANYGIGIVTLKGDFVYVNDCFAQIHGYKREELNGKSLKIFHSPDQLEKVDRLNQMVSEGNDYSSEEVWHTHRNGTVFPMLMNGTTIKDENNKPIYIVASAVDITEFKKAEERRKYLERVINLNTAVVFVWKNQEQWPVEYVSENVKAVLGYDPEEFYSGKVVFHDLVHEDDERRVSMEVESYSKSNLESFTQEYRLVEKDGKEIWVDDRTLVRRNVDGEITHFEGIIIDITDRKLAEALEREKRDVIQASQAKSEFLANMSHEIRTPMNAILGFTDIVINSPNTSHENKEALNVVKDSGESLMQIINDILDISKIEAGKLDIHNYTFSIRDSLDIITKSFSLSIKSKSLQMNCNIDHDVPDMLIGDAGRMRQILVNIVGNSVKFTENGEISINVGVHSKINDVITLQFDIKDTGIGIPEEKQEVIFEAFIQADPSTTRHYGGTGLGLAICSRLVKMMNGKVWLESNLGKGSFFHILLPFRTLENRSGSQELSDKKEKPMFESAPKDARSVKILVAEDNFANRELIKMILEKNNYSSIMATNGKEALEMLTRENFDLILMDVQMPLLNGYETAAEIRKKEAESGSIRIPIIGVTAHAMEEDKIKCLNAGMDDHLPKPITEDSFLETIKKWTT
jgi:PAS domain S-box-containing protein